MEQIDKFKHLKLWGKIKTPTYRVQRVEGGLVYEELKDERVTKARFIEMTFNELK